MNPKYTLCSIFEILIQWLGGVLGGFFYLIEPQILILMLKSSFGHSLGGGFEPMLGGYKTFVILWF